MNKKICLEINNLRVETFATAHDPTLLRGTVHGRNYTRDPEIACQQDTISGTMPCLCASAGEQFSCDTTCNPDQCDCMSAPCVSAGGLPCG